MPKHSRGKLLFLNKRSISDIGEILVRYRSGVRGIECIGNTLFIRNGFRDPVNILGDSHSCSGIGISTGKILDLGIVVIIQTAQCVTMLATSINST